MKIDGLMPFNGETIQTKKLKELGFTTKDINKLLNDNILSREKRGYYIVNMDCSVDISLMQYYLLNNCYEEFLEYFESLKVKDYQAYYYRFLCDILMNNYNDAYDNLSKCCELNKEKENKVNLYAYVLLLNEMINLSTDKLALLKNNIFNDEDSFGLFLESIINKNYDGAYDNLRVSKDCSQLSKLDVKVLRDLSIKAGECYQRKNSPEKKKYDSLFDSFYGYILSNDFDSAYMVFRNLCVLDNKLSINDYCLKIVDDLYNCFNYIVTHPYVNLNTYKTNYKYKKDSLLDNFYLALKKNDYLSALKFIILITKEDDKREYIIYKILLERIHNFLNIRSVMMNYGPSRNSLSLNNLIEEKRYQEALDLTNKSTRYDTHDKNMITSLLESLVALESSEN